MAWLALRYIHEERIWKPNEQKNWVLDGVTADLHFKVLEMLSERVRRK